MKKLEFKCNQIDNENIPIDILKNSNLSFPNLHKNSNDIACVSKFLKEYKKDSICKVPFCTTVEAESFGAIINLGDEKNTPRIKEYVFSNIEELSNINNIDFNKGRIKEVLKSINILTLQDEIVSLNVCGPITIVSLLLDLKYFYKGVRKNLYIIEKIMNIIEDNIVNYIIKGYQNGAKIISYSDPVGDINIVGPKVYEDVVSKTTLNILNRVLPYIEDGIIHLCGKTSTALCNLNKCSYKTIEYEGSLTYGEAILNVINNKDIKIIGNNCLKRSQYKLNHSKIYIISLNN